MLKNVTENVDQSKRPLLATVFLSGDESRLRAGWRLLAFIILYAVLSIVGSIIIDFIKLRPDLGIPILCNQFMELLSITTAAFLSRRFIDRQPIISLGLKWNNQALKDLLIGILIPFFMMGLIFAVEVYMGWLKFEKFSWQPENNTIGGFLIWLVIFLIVGWQEEIFSRGYVLQNLTSGLNLFWGVLISSSIFAALHFRNPDSTWGSTIGILLAGLFLAFPYILTRQLWISIGLHIGWNFFEGVLFGFPVSGNETFHLIHHVIKGPELMTGGGFGPEAGLVLIPALVLGVILIYSYTILREKQAF